MRYLMIVKGNSESEAGGRPNDDQLEQMAKFNEQMVNAGVMLAGDGLKPTSEGVRVAYAGSKRTVKNGPFADTGDIVAGYWLIRVNSKEEALSWAKRVPFEEGEVELRPLFELQDFGHSEAVEHHRRIQQQIAQH